MKRRAFLRRFAMGVMASGMLADALVRGGPRVAVAAPTPVAARVYVRRAIDNHIAKSLASHPSAFADLNQRIFDQMWDAYR